MFNKQITHHPWAHKVALLLLALAFAGVAQIATAQSAVTATYYVSPSGNDSSNGSSTDAAWATFARAWQTLQPGDTLLVMDGTYKEAVQPNIRNGEPGKPITIRAVNDGKAVIDGEGKRIPVRLGENWGPSGAIGNWYVVEGLVARNGTTSGFRIERADNNILRRISAYNSDSNDNSQLIMIAWGNNNLIEDCVAAGTGRYMIDVYDSHNSTVRRCFTMWQQWDGRNFCGVSWPNGNNVGIYNSSDTTVENVIAYGRALTGIFAQANSDTAVARNNSILGSMALLQGKDYDGSVWNYGSYPNRPGPTTCADNVTQWSWPGHRTGFSLWGQGILENNVFGDILSVDNAGVGLSVSKPYGPGDKNTTLDHATIYGNGVGAATSEGGPGTQVVLSDGVKVTNSNIAGITSGEGARLVNRYINRQLTDQPLWPWPMEDRVQNELGLSVTDLAARYIDPSSNPGPFPTPAPTPAPSPTPEPGQDSFSMTVTPGAQVAKRNSIIEFKVTLSAVGQFSQPVRIDVTDSSTGLQMQPDNAMVSVPGETTFQINTGNDSGVHVLKFTAQAEGTAAVEQEVYIAVDTRPLFLPAVIK